MWFLPSRRLRRTPNHQPPSTCSQPPTRQSLRGTQPFHAIKPRSMATCHILRRKPPPCVDPATPRAGGRPAKTAREERPSRCRAEYRKPPPKGGLPYSARWFFGKKHASAPPGIFEAPLSKILFRVIQCVFLRYAGRIFCPSGAKKRHGGQAPTAALKDYQKAGSPGRSPRAAHPCAAGKPPFGGASGFAARTTLVICGELVSNSVDNFCQNDNWAPIHISSTFYTGLIHTHSHTGVIRSSPYGYSLVFWWCCPINKVIQISPAPTTTTAVLC